MELFGDYGGFDGKVVAVTGGARGIGRAISALMADLGARVAVMDVSVVPEVRHASVPHGTTGMPTAIECDVADEASVDRAFTILERELGPADVLVNNAGIIRRGTSQTLLLHDWERVVAVNLTGTYLCSVRAIPNMKARRYGRIVNVSSIAGKIGDITAAPCYGASKGGVNALTKSLARELAPCGITVNAVAPHAIETEMSAEWSAEKRAGIVASLPVGRLGRPEEVAAAVAFLASDMAGFITGTVLDINGGYLMD